MLPLGTTFEISVREEQLDAESLQSVVWLDASCKVIEPPDVHWPSPDLILRCDPPEHAHEVHRRSPMGQTMLESALNQMRMGIKCAIALRQHGLEVAIEHLRFHPEHFQPIRFMLHTYYGIRRGLEGADQRHQRVE